MMKCVPSETFSPVSIAWFLPSQEARGDQEEKGGAPGSCRRMSYSCRNLFDNHYHFREPYLTFIHSLADIAGNRHCILYYGD